MSHDDPFVALCDALRGADWRADALCKEYQHLDWFPERGVPIREQLQVCGRCLVRLECLQTALDANERHGIWGGHSQLSFRNLKRLRAVRAREGGPAPSAADLEALADHPSKGDDHAAA